MGECMAWRYDRMRQPSPRNWGGGVAYPVELQTDQYRGTKSTRGWSAEGSSRQTCSISLKSHQRNTPQKGLRADWNSVHFLYFYLSERRIKSSSNNDVLKLRRCQHKQQQWIGHVIKQFALEELVKAELFAQHVRRYALIKISSPTNFLLVRPILSVGKSIKIVVAKSQQRH